MSHLSLTTSSDYSSIILLTRKFLQLSGYDCPFTAHLLPFLLCWCQKFAVPHLMYLLLGGVPGFGQITQELNQSPLCQNPRRAEGQEQGRKMRGSATGEAQWPRARQTKGQSQHWFWSQGNENYLLNTLWFCSYLTQTQGRPISAEICAKIIQKCCFSSAAVRALVAVASSATASFLHCITSTSPILDRVSSPE